MSFSFWLISLCIIGSRFIHLIKTNSNVLLFIAEFKSPSRQGYGFSCGHVWMWELDCEEGWVQKNWCFWTVVLEKTLESPLDCKEIQPVHTEGDQPWDFFGRNDAKAETPVLWPPHAKSWLIWKDADAGRDWGQEEKGTTEDEMAGWHQRLDGREFEWTPGVGDGQGGLACCDSWGHKESDTTEQLNWTELKRVDTCFFDRIINKDFLEKLFCEHIWRLRSQLCKVRGKVLQTEWEVQKKPQEATKLDTLSKINYPALLGIHSKVRERLEDMEQSGMRPEKESYKSQYGICNLFLMEWEAMGAL